MLCLRKLHIVSCGIWMRRTPGSASASNTRTSVGKQLPLQCVPCTDVRGALTWAEVALARHQRVDLVAEGGVLAVGT